MTRGRLRLGALLTPLLLALPGFADEPRPVKNGEPLPNTKPLTTEGDLASQLVDGIDRFLLGELDKSVERRARHWKRDLASADAYASSIESNRKRLAHILGVRDARVPIDEVDPYNEVNPRLLLAQSDTVQVSAVRWQAFGNVHAEGLLLLSPKVKPQALVIALPDAGQTPEQLAGLAPGTPPEAQFARRLAESGCHVLVPALVDRRLERRNGRANLSSREYLYRPAFEMGRHLIGYEVQKVLAAVDKARHGDGARGLKIGVMGWGEGGLVALCAAALDPRIDAVCVSGFFDDRRNVWREPIDRNVFGLLDQFGDAELASLVAPRPILIEACKGPEVTLSGDGGAPARLVTPKLRDVRTEAERARRMVSGLAGARLDVVVSGDGTGPCGTSETLGKLLGALAPGLKLAAPGKPLQPRRQDVDPKERQDRQVREIDRHTQALLVESPYVRQAFVKKLYDQTQGGGPSPTPEKYQEAAKEYRKIFAEDVVGRFDYDLLPPNARTRKAYEADKWTGYEVVLDVFPDVIAYGILLLPKDLKEGERRPVVVCQHGLEGRPRDVIGKEGYAYYKAFAARLAERGFITFAPQNPYIFTDRFRTLQRKANPLGKTLFSVIAPQHQQILNWLKKLPNVDGERIAFYGLSYGGKSAMRLPALLPDYCLSICSADFNEWVGKNASTRSPHSYVWTGEYEIFEFDLGSTFNYAEMAALIAPRPFMVERGHFDGVASDETVAYEFAKVRFLYAARLKLPDRCAIEWFDGPHTINGKGTFAFLHRHLKWPEPK